MNRNKLSATGNKVKEKTKNLQKKISLKLSIYIDILEFTSGKY